MAMDRINGSPLVRPGALDSFNVGKGQDERSVGDASGKAAGSAGAAKGWVDKAEISPEARQLVDLRQAVEAGRAALQRLPEVREDRVQEARERLVSGFYNSSEVRDDVAGKLARVMTAMSGA